MLPLTDMLPHVLGVASAKVAVGFLSNQHSSQVNIDFVLVVLISVVEREAVNAWQNTGGPSWQLGSLTCFVFCRLVLMGLG